MDILFVFINFAAEGVKKQTPFFFSHYTNVCRLGWILPSVFVQPNCLFINCELHYSDGSPIDSNTVYMYKTGLLNMSYSNCYTRSGYDIVTGTNYTIEICDLSGTFNLVLATKNNQLISITEGIIKVYNITR